MARDFLAALVGTRHPFAAILVRTGEDPSGRRTVLLRDVIWREGCWVTDHCWLPFTPEWAPLCARLGARVRFTATVRPYRRGDGGTDYALAEVGDLRARG